jgi:DNA-directed RNA polymerase specialized sigma24 family protein
MQRQVLCMVQPFDDSPAAMRPDPDKQKDLLQEMHMELWKSLGSFDGRCSLRTWVYRVAHNVGASHVVSGSRPRRNSPQRWLLDSRLLARASVPGEALYGFAPGRTTAITERSY